MRILKECPVCIRNRLLVCEQRMGNLPEERLHQCPPWTNVSLDYAGPFKIKDAVKGRTTKKCWAAVYAYQNTKAVKIFPVLG